MESKRSQLEAEAPKPPQQHIREAIWQGEGEEVDMYVQVWSVMLGIVLIDHLLKSISLTLFTKSNCLNCVFFNVKHIFV